MHKEKPRLFYTLIALPTLCALLLITLFSINHHVKRQGSKYILSPTQAEHLEDVDCILVLGCFVRSDGNPSGMLTDRLTRSIELYRAGISDRLLMSGDHGQKDYDEVGAMKRFALQNGVESDAVFMDHAGFSTYESLYRARDVFGCQKIVIVTQQYHLYRAIYTARALGMEAYGVASDLHEYSGQTMRTVREIFARNKDFFFCLFEPEPTHLGESISLALSGDVTNDSTQDFFI